MIDADLVARIHAAGGRVIAWTVNDLDAARHLIALGTDGICTDISGTMCNELAEWRH
jgi:glycerophosphoryl diester phosphodiesterase